MTALVYNFNKKKWFDGKENSSVTQYAAAYITNIIISDDHVKVTGIFSHIKSAGSSVFILLFLKYIYKLRGSSIIFTP